ncbi:UNVERIFIED_CONTAM: hypothetical protein Slati_0573300 [Sesamum latifolium]|uniref:Uncharacterized protein n=1 Tax=Sesamum latifolium TaxID=2727402 RepID=A0AAW2Y153_9LAMI
MAAADIPQGGCDLVYRKTLCQLALGFWQSWHSTAKSEASIHSDAPTINFQTPGTASPFTNSYVAQLRTSDD